MSIDEAMVKYKGRVFFGIYMPKKPIKWGIKVWMIAEPKTGYISNFTVYLGKCSSRSFQEYSQDNLCLKDTLTAVSSHS